MTKRGGITINLSFRLPSAWASLSSCIQNNLLQQLLTFSAELS